MLAQMGSDPVQEAISSMEKQHEDEKQGNNSFKEVLKSFGAENFNFMFNGKLASPAYLFASACHIVK